MVFNRFHQRANLSASLATVLFAGLGASALGQVTVCASLTLSGAAGNGDSPPLGVGAKISADRRYAVFASRSTNFVPDSSGGFVQIYRKDLLTGVIQMVSTSAKGRGGNGDSFNPCVSADGRFVSFSSYASDLVSSSYIPVPPGEGGDVNGVKDVFVHDTWTGLTRLVSNATGGAQGNAESDSSAISADGRFIAFRSMASNFALGDLNGLSDVFVHDVATGTTTLVSASSSGISANGTTGFFQVAITPDGRYVGFTSDASNLVSGDTNNANDVFVRDLVTGTTRRISLGAGSTQGNSNSFTCAFSADGRYAAFSSDATNLVKKDTNLFRDVFVRDLVAGTTVRVSVDSTGKQANAPSGATNDGWGVSAISENGRYVAFQTFATNLFGPGPDRNGSFDIFVRDLQLGLTRMASVTPAGTPGNGDSRSPSLSADGSYILFSSSATTLVVEDTTDLIDVFVRGQAR